MGYLQSWVNSVLTHGQSSLTAVFPLKMAIWNFKGPYFQTSPRPMFGWVDTRYDKHDLNVVGCCGPIGSSILNHTRGFTCGLLLGKKQEQWMVKTCRHMLKARGLRWFEVEYPSNQSSERVGGVRICDDS